MRSNAWPLRSLPDRLTHMSLREPPLMRAYSCPLTFVRDSPFLRSSLASANSVAKLFFALPACCVVGVDVASVVVEVAAVVLAAMARMSIATVVGRRAAVLERPGEFPTHD